MLSKVKELMGKKECRKPIHVALTMNGIRAWAENNKKQADEAYNKSFEILLDVIHAQVERDIRILSVYVMPEFMKNPVQIKSSLAEFIDLLSTHDIIHKNQVKVSVLGKWYDMPSTVLDPLKKIVSETKDYDKFFLNLCINYNGKAEIVDACKLIVRKALAEKITPESIDKQMIKDNLYTSYFLPPEILIKTGEQYKTFGFLLWDSARAEIKFAGKLWPDFSKEEFVKLVCL